MAEPAWDVRPLAVGDCDELGRVHVQVWQQAYAAHMPADYLAGLSAADRAARWREIARDPGGSTCLVARDPAGTLVGFASAGPCRDGEAPTPLELYAIYLLSEVHGTGLADLLVQRLIGDEPAHLWVIEGNARARAFYERHGFRVDGAAKVHGASGALEVRMTRLSGSR